MILLKRIVAITTVFAMFFGVVGPAQAITVEELEAQIADLLSTLASLQNQLAALKGETPTVTGCTITSFDRNLQQGMSGADVKCLQIILNSDPGTQLASSGVGSPGQETEYFGPLTKAAVIKFQEKYATDVLAPWGLTTGTGYVGSTTRAKLDELLGTTPPVTECTTDADCAAGYTCSAGTCIMIPVGEGFTVSLASDTPVASSVVAGQSTAPLTKFIFVNGTSSPVKVTNIKLTRLGVSADSTLSNVYLFNGAVRLTDSASVSSGIITFNDSTGIFTVPVNSSVTITASSDIASGTSGQTLGVGIASASDITADATVEGTFPINGNLMTVATATLASVTYSSSVTPSANTSLDPQDDFTVWQNSLSISSRAVDLTRISFRNIGSIDSDDLQNFRFYVDGTQVGSAMDSLDEDGYVTFDLTADPERLNTGTRTLKLVADIVGGSNRTFRFSIRNAADATFVDSQYGVNVLATASGSFPVQAGQQTVSTGTITITKKTTSPSDKVILDQSAASLALYEIKAAGEAVKIETLDVSFAFVDEGSTAQSATGPAATNANSLDNGQLYADGVQIGSTTDISENSDTTTSSTAYTQFSLGSSLIVKPGSPVELEVKADVTDGDGTDNIDADDTIQIIIEADTSNAIGQTSGEIINVPSSDVAANTLTVSTGGLSLAKYTAFPNYSYVVPQTAAKLAHYTLNANTSEDVNINTIQVDFTESGSFDGSSHITNAYVTYGAETTVTKSTVTDDDNDWSISYTLAAGETIDIVVYGDLSSSASDTVTCEVQVTGVTSSSGSTVYGNGTGTNGTDEVVGQTITITTGTFEAAFTGEPLTQVVAGDQTITAVEYKFTAQVDSYTIRELKVRLPSGSSGAVQNAILKSEDGSTTYATRPFDTTGAEANDTAYFTGLDIDVPANDSIVLRVDLQLSTPAADSTATTGRDVKLTLYLVKHESSAGTLTSDTTPGASNSNPAGNSIYVYKAYPTVVANNSGLGSTFVNGSETSLYQFKVTAVNGDIAMKQLKFSVAWNEVTTTPDLELESLKLFRGSTNLTSSVTIQDEDGTSLESTSGASDTTTSTIYVSWDSGLEETVAEGTTVTYTLKGTPQGFGSSTAGKDSVSLQLTGSESSADVRNYLSDPSSGDGIYALAATQGATSGTATKFIWSDISAVIHSAADATSSNDWHSGYLLDEFDLSSKGWSL
jgi:hypothetical protein